MERNSRAINLMESFYEVNWELLENQKYLTLKSPQFYTLVDFYKFWKNSIPALVNYFKMKQERNLREKIYWINKSGIHETLHAAADDSFRTDGGCWVLFFQGGVIPGYGHGIRTPLSELMITLGPNKFGLSSSMLDGFRNDRVVVEDLLISLGYQGGLSQPEAGDFLSGVISQVNQQVSLRIQPLANVYPEFQHLLLD